MAYKIADTVFDTALNYLKNNCDTVVVLSGDPASYSEAITNNGGSNKKIATVSVTSSSFTVADGAADGRKVTVAAQNDIAVVADGDASHVAWLDTTTNLEILFVTQLTTNRTGLTTSDTLDIPAHFAAFRDAVVAS